MPDMRGKTIETCAGTGEFPIGLSVVDCFADG
jgi:hypothetical protein